MGRVIIQLLAIFVLPFLLYAVYYLFARQRARRQGGDAPSWEDGPWFWLSISGLVLMVVAFVVFNAFDAGEPQRIVLPPTLER